VVTSEQRQVPNSYSITFSSGIPHLFWYTYKNKGVALWGNEGIPLDKLIVLCPGVLMPPSHDLTKNQTS
uniref:Uncharacterized protein n=1 Tax=Oryza brachyantha TaxID=4533 RepID=J3M7R3_ORYBR